MIAKCINKKQFKEAIRISFDGDDKIYGLYNPNVKVENIDDIVKDISERVESDVRGIAIKGAYEDNSLVGYYAYAGDTLVSFGLSVEHRQRKHLKALWGLIRKDLKGAFQCYLFTRNIRGCKWLQKNGMKIFQQDSSLTHLIF